MPTLFLVHTVRHRKLTDLFEAFAPVAGNIDERG